VFWDTFIDLCAKNGKKPNPVAKELGFGSSAVTYWKRGTVPSDISLKKIADYFSVSVDYLLGKTEQKEKPSPEGESLEEDVIIVHRDGKTVVRKYTKEQLDAIEAILNQIGDSES
jgi:transcriptional regulator with XRE-family HTH domain